MFFRRSIHHAALACGLLLTQGCGKKPEPLVPLEPAGVEIRVRVLAAEKVLLWMPGRVAIHSVPDGRLLFRGEFPGTVAAGCAGGMIELGGRTFTRRVRVALLDEDSTEASLDPAPGVDLRREPLAALRVRDGAKFSVTAILDGTGESSYRGALELRADEGQVTAVNSLDLQHYLLGVVSAEMPAYFDAEALAAQAIASRTFALYNIERARLNGRRGVFRANTGFQVYKGVAAETPSTRKAVIETRGEALFWQGSLFSSYFHSTCGGQTANANEALGVAGIAPLSGVACGGCVGSSFWKWSSELSALQLATVAREYLEKNSPEVELGEVEALEIVEKSADGRVLYFRLRHSLGAFEWRADSFRLKVESSYPGTVRSTFFTVARTATGNWAFSGSGFGHGVGLCQVGARGLAREGRKYREILQHYYPGSELTKAY